jgi:hypothetical protein
MPITVTVDHAHHRVLARCHGVVTYQDVERHLQFEEQQRGLSYEELFDTRGATTTITSAEIWRLVHRVHALQRSHPPFGATAIVADSDVLYGMARMFAILNDVPDGDVRPRVEVFRDTGEAELWLRAQSQESGEGA